MSTAAEKLLLYVEDNPDHADLVLQTLARHRPSTRVVHVEDGETALEYLRGKGADVDGRPSLILLDLRLPRVDGFEVLRTVKSSPDLSAIPVVVLTTSSSDSDVARAYANKVNSYLVKPDDFVTLDDMMRDLGEYWLVWNTATGGAR